MTEHEDFEALLGQFERQHATKAKRPPQVGDRVHGTVASIGREHVYVNLGIKSDAIIDIQEVTDTDGNLTLSVGDPVDMAISAIDADSGTLLLGSKHGRRLHGAAGLEQAYEQHLPVEGHVTGITKGGLEVDIAGVRAFCPASQASNQFVEDLSSYVGQRLAFRITKFEGGKHTNLVVSRRELLEEERRAKAIELRAKVVPGANLPGVVTSLQTYGAFIDLGGVEGMVHISEIAFERVRHPSDVLSVGQQVEVAVLRVDETGNPKQPQKIALSLRALSKNPWTDADRQFPAGTRVKGKVTRVQPFGAFVELAPGIEGLVHISELGAGRRVTHPNEVLNAGDEVEATVLGVDLDKRRISLSLDPNRLVAAEPGPKAADYAKPSEGMGTLGDLLRQRLSQGPGQGQSQSQGKRRPG
ncbi:MAG TPA: 30S ribosomal protein S1 [Chromatiaceae bacterium]|jgi:small subunit ribosomal protein S1|nr:30S ribosomal protein S1 [Chromatiaceae bacterium]